MSALEITDALLPKLSEFDVVILNYANGDMVGHTGKEPAAIRAMEFLDEQLSRLVPAVLKLGGTILITADMVMLKECGTMKIICLGLRIRPIP